MGLSAERLRADLDALAAKEPAFARALAEAGCEDPIVLVQDYHFALLPRMIHIRGVPRLTTLVRLVAEEAGADSAGRDLVLARLVEILLIEALRAARSHEAPPGLLLGLADQRVADALRQIHGRPERPWTVVELARSAGMSRTAFFERFMRKVGLRPMEYLLAWRMALAKTLLAGGDLALDEVARQVGYGSASTFSTAFSRHVGQPPRRYARAGLRVEQG